MFGSYGRTLGAASLGPGSSGSQFKYRADRLLAIRSCSSTPVSPFWSLPLLVLSLRSMYTHLFLPALASVAAAQTYSATYLPSNAPAISEQGQSGTNKCGTGSNQTSVCQNAYCKLPLTLLLFHSLLITVLYV